MDGCRIAPRQDRSDFNEKGSDMRFSICVMADIDEIGFFSHAEALGYDSVWVADSQMLFSDCYAVLALAARHRRTPSSQLECPNPR